jgi:hypothetical protein
MKLQLLQRLDGNGFFLCRLEINERIGKMGIKPRRL